MERMERKEILEEAARIVTGERQNQYGDAEDSFGLIAGLWGDYLNHPVSSKDVALMMILLKVAREKGGNGKADNWVDIAGYAACGGEIATAAKSEKSKDYLKTVTDAMKSKYIKFLQDLIDEQTEGKHIPAGINGPFAPSYPPKAGAKCCCTDKADGDEDIAQIAAENERKRELLRAIFGTVTVPDESGDESEAEADSIADIVKELREISDNLYRVANDLEEEDEDDED